MKKVQRTAFLGAVGLVIATVTVTAAGAPPEEEQRKDEAAPKECPGLEQQGKQADRGAAAPHGPLALFGHALQKVCLDDEQRNAIEELGEKVSEKEAAVVQARHALRSALLEQIEAGKIDEGDLRDEVDALVQAREEASPVLRKALEDLHGILDPGQREAFVDAVEARMDELRDSSKGWRDDLEKDLRLTGEQKDRLRALLDKGKPALDEERERAGRVLDAFESDEFSIERVVPKADVGERTRGRAESMIGIGKELVAILSPEQRAKLVNRLEDRMTPPGQPGQPGQLGDQGATTGAADGTIGETEQPIMVARGGFRAGGVRGWGGGYRGGYVGGYRGGYAGGGYVARGASVSTGYAAGYPLVGGYGPGIW